MLIEVTIQGVSPLLMHRFNADAEESVQKGNRRAHRGEEGTPREQADKFAHKLPDGTLAVPIQAIYAAIINAGRFHKHGKNKLTTNSSTLVTSFVHHRPDLDGEYLSLGTRNYEVDSRRIVNQATRGAHICHRPRLDPPWTLKFHLDVDEECVTEGLVRNLVDDAGSKIGILAFRPEKRGYFGRFVVKSWRTVIAPLPLGMDDHPPRAA